MPNPNPGNIPDAIWWFWEEFKEFEPSVELGGIYANKSGYHNSRRNNLANWPKDYSIRDAIDKQGPDDKAAAIDLTFPNAKNGDYSIIKKYSQRLMAAGRAKDPRVAKLKEFFGNADDDREVEGWDFRRSSASTSDTSHLWHIHISFSRAYVNDMQVMRDLLSVLTDGATTGGITLFCKLGDFNEAVAGLQALLHGLGQAVTVDGKYGPMTAAALKAALGDPNNNGEKYGPWEYAALLVRNVGGLNKGKDGKDGKDATVDITAVAAAVAPKLQVTVK